MSSQSSSNSRSPTSLIHIYKTSHQHNAANTAATCPPYNAAEKAWLKEVWKNEFHFLLAYELNIYKEEDREEGRYIVRAIMEVEAENEAEDKK